MKFVASAFSVLSFSIATIVGCSGTGKNNKDEHLNVDASRLNVLPSIRIKDASGNIINLHQFKGKKVFLNLWATWCPPCRREIPSIEKLYAATDKNKTAFILLSLDEDFEAAKNYAKQNNLKAPVYFAVEELPPLLQVDGIPVTFIFNQNGKLLKRVDGMEDYYTQEYIRLLK